MTSEHEPDDPPLRPAPEYRARFMYDWGSGTWLWAANDATREAFNYPIDHRQLPLAVETMSELDRLAALHDEALNWEDPREPGPWREHQCISFNQIARHALARLRSELGPTWEVIDAYRDLHEDPNLDR